MLLDVLQGADAGTFIIFLDTANFSGRCLLKSYINTALKREDVVHVLEFEVSEEELRDGLDSQCGRRMHFHGGFADPLGWMKRSSFNVHQFISQDLSTLLTQTQQSRSAVLVMDSLSWLLRHLDPVVVCQRLQELKRGGAVKTIIGLLHSDLHQTSVVESVCHLASTVISLAPWTKGPWALAKTTKRTKSGKVLQEEELFSVQEDLTITVHSKVSHAVPTQAEPDSEADPTANLTFNLHLSEMEREAKEKVALPFVFSHEKKSALLNPGQGAGRILYEPDENDDFDQEDPDEDLDV
ncbi:elongator complex protein 5 isoform X1 [Alosa sapidissima]|uniref:elongator complex protein 5 isoform X1 n=1 Tax=Alosa sapidissima TaxID=34773 RepID=UPI001C095862|nr:elongator complex protein 5 isoform X1 [Alosa sapidissima]XP_041924992.1 elongator complex protein 5 isoform X1 [Alosa sapidissima]